MKNIFSFLIVLMMWTTHTYSQYNNEWIDHSKTYYKFKVGKTGLYRIKQSDLIPVGLQNANADQFQLWRNGKEIPLLTSVNNAALNTNDYLEFWGEANDGKADKILYRDPSYQLSDRISLETDTASYFLTVNNGTNLRLQNVFNKASGTGLTPLQYFMHTIRRDFKDQINKGRAIYLGVYVYSSEYDIGEGWTSNDIAPSTAFSGTITNDVKQNFSGPAGVLNIGLAGNSKDGTGRSVRILMNDAELIKQPLGDFEAKSFNATVPASVFSSFSGFTYQINYTSPSSFDRIVASYIEYVYPRNFDFDNASQFSFTLPASTSETFIKIKNFNGGSNAVLYDLTNLQYYTPVVVSGEFQFVLSSSSAERQLILVNRDNSNINSISSFQKRNFTDYKNASNQGDYIFIAGSSLMNISSLSEYKNYRSSSAGGSFKTQIVDAEELIDQFAFGIKKHPLGIKNFLRYARAKYGTQPKYCLLIGKGITYDDYRLNENNPVADVLNQVPTFGYPASDILLASENYEPIPATLIGRISVLNDQELKIYIDKLKEYEAQQANTTQTVANKLWMKNVVFVAGLNSGPFDATIDGYFNGYKPKIQDSLFGGKVTHFSNSTTGPITPEVNKQMLDLFSEGLTLFNYFGHSSATNLDYVIDDASTFKNQGKYPLFLLNGCNAGNVYSFDPDRLQHVTSIVEKFVLTPKAGAIGFIGSTHYGITTYLDLLNIGFYNSLKKAGYGVAVSQNLKDAQSYLVSASPDVFVRNMQAGEHILNGDPALVLNAHAKPDYAIEDADVKIEPTVITVAQNSFRLKVFIHNLGRYTGDSVSVSIVRHLPNGIDSSLFHKKIRSIAYTDSIVLDVPVLPSLAKGENKIDVAIDDINAVSELSESNNVITKSFQIISDDVEPVYPYDLSILPAPINTFYASTADPFLNTTQFFFELDTTLNFSSSLLYQTSVTTKGGLIEFNYPAALQQNLVYYWRVGLLSNGTKVWRNASFIVIPNTRGFNQSHSFQHLQSSTDRINKTESGWNFAQKNNSMRARLAILGTSSGFQSEFSLMLNGEYITRFYCLGRSVIVNVLNGKSLQPLYNQAVPSAVLNSGEGGFMGSAASCDPSRNINFEFSVADAASRNKLKDFLDWIPNGYFVVLRNINDGGGANTYVNDWKNDIGVYGAGNTFYDRLKTAGFSGVENYTFNRVWVFAYKKNDNSFLPQEKFSDGIYDRVNFDFPVSSSDSSGTISSPRIGPAKKWTSVLWNGKTNIGNTRLDVFGIDISGKENLLVSAAPGENLNLSGVNSTQYPYLKLRLNTSDGNSFSPFQLDAWRVLYTPVPEGALAPAIKFDYKDTIEAGEPLVLGIPFKNISPDKFDSIQLKLTVTDQKNQSQVFDLPKTKKLDANDTAWISKVIDTKNLSGTAIIHLDVNPDNSQPEQTHSNNFFYRNVFVKSDKINPLLDVSFDGVHIMNNDLVSSSPHIQIKLKDNSKFLLLNDTSSINVQLKYPNGELRLFKYDNDTLIFRAATNGNDNTAIAEFSPILKEDGTYQLIIRSKDAGGNFTAVNDYTISFKVMNKAMISDMFNYPNPFTTSTAFVFTLTGNEVPQNLRIQILTVTGKVVKEIKKEELGPIHIGKNITEYKWDGADSYGQSLGNGVYLYRVITNLNGKSLEKLNISDSRGDTIDTQKFFNSGYGKMYLMR